MVIDQTLAFIGGIDLAFGRWDTHCHRLGDHGRPPALNPDREEEEEEEEEEEVDAGRAPMQKWIGKDYYNTFVKDFIDLDSPLDGEWSAMTELGICRNIIHVHSI